MTAILTPRQAEVLRCIAQGKSNNEIARELNIALGSVKIHVSALYRRLAIHNRSQAAVCYVRLATSGAFDRRAAA